MKLPRRFLSSILFCSLVVFGSNLGAVVSVTWSFGGAGGISLLPVPKPAVAPAGLIGWWKGENDAVDVVAGNNGTLQNCSFTNGEVGRAFAFDPENLPFGTYSGVQAADSAAYALTNALTIEGWLRPRGDGYLIFFRGDHRPGLDPYYLSMQNNNVIRFGITDAAGNPAYVDTTLNYYAWTHVAASLDGDAGTLSIYTNGVLAAQVTTSIRPFGELLPDQSPGIGIGNVNDGGNNFPFVGDIDEISLYNRALTVTEIQAIFNAGRAGKKLLPAVPAIADFSPVVATNGATLVITGTNFSPVAASNIVYFGAVRAKILSASPNQISVIVPVGATHSPITVTANGLVAASGQVFEPIFQGSGSLAADHFGPGFILPAGDTVAGTAVGDLDGDGRPDLVVINAHGNSIGIYRNLGLGSALSTNSFAPPFNLALPGNPIALLLADLDGDGRLDLMVTDSQNDQVCVFKNASTPGNLTTNSFPARANFSVGHQPFGMAVGDLNGDGYLDIVTANNGDNTISMLRNLGGYGSGGAITFAQHVDLPAPAGPESVAIGDLDRDGWPDIVSANHPANSLSIWRNLRVAVGLGTNSFDTPVNLTGSGGGEAVVIGDVDGDGRPDLLASGYLSQSLSIFQNLSSPGDLSAGSFGPRLDFAAGGRAHRIALADLDGDARPEVCVTTELPDQFLIFHNASDGGNLANSSLSAPVALAAGWNPNAISLADLDGDGRADVVFANSYNSNLSVYRNQMPLDAWTLPFADSLVLDLPLDGSLVDDGPNHFSVTAIGNGVFVTNGFSVPNSAYALNGVDQNIFIANDARLYPDEFTFSAWVNFSDLYGTFWRAGNASTDGWRGFFLTLDGGKLNYVDVNGADYDAVINVETNLSPGVWYHLVVTRTTNACAIYLNDILVGSQTGLTPYAKPQFTGMSFGSNMGDPDGFAQYSPATFDAIRLYNRALSADEVGKLYGYESTRIPLTIISQPSSQTISAGGRLNLSVTAVGTAPLTYQWSFNGTNLPGANHATLSLTNIHARQAGNYQVTVSNPEGSVTSDSAVLTVVPMDILVYSYSGIEKITTLNNEPTINYQGRMFYLPASTNGVFVGWAVINGQKQYWVSPFSTYICYRIPGKSGHTVTVLGRARYGYDGSGLPHFLSDFHRGQNATLAISAKKKISFPALFTCADNVIDPNPQTGDLVLREANSTYVFQSAGTQTANNAGQTLGDLQNALTTSLEQQGYHRQ